MAVVYIDENGKKYKRGDKREDGYIFTGMRKQPSGNIKPKFLSPEAFEKRMKSQYEYYRKPEQVAKSSKRHINKYRTDPIYRLRHNQRKRISIAFERVNKKHHKSMKSMRLIGCTQEELVQHIEAQFQKGMSWNNYGSKWHVDHIIPISWFDLSSEMCQKIAFGYKNLQPLWKKENLLKGARYYG